MSSVLTGFVTVWLVIAVGWLLAHLGVIDLKGQRFLARLAFLVAMPLQLFVTLRTADVGRVFSTNVIVSLLAILTTVALYLVIARTVWRREAGHLVIGAFCASYVNANNMGMPIAQHVLGDTSWVAPILLLQVVALQPFGLTLLDVAKARREGRRASWASNLTLPLRNPMTIGTGLGLLVNLAHIPVPTPILAPATTIAGMAVPMMLIAFGASLRLQPVPRPGPELNETLVVAVLKLLVQPVIAWSLARWVFHLDLATSIAVMVMAGLPTAQNVFTFANRYDQSVRFSRDAIFVTTITSLVSISLLVALAHA